MRTDLEDVCDYYTGEGEHEEANLHQCGNMPAM